MLVLFDGALWKRPKRPSWLWWWRVNPLTDIFLSFFLLFISILEIWFCLCVCVVHCYRKLYTSHLAYQLLIIYSEISANRVKETKERTKERVPVPTFIWTGRVGFLTDNVEMTISIDCFILQCLELCCCCCYCVSDVHIAPKWSLTFYIRFNIIFSIALRCLTLLSILFFHFWCMTFWYLVIIIR